MSTRGFRYFVAVARLGSFSAASRRLHIAQSALSRHVKALEGLVGVPLLIREPRGVRMTAEGEELLSHAVHLLDQLEALPRLVGPKSKRVAGRVTVGLPTSVSTVVSAPLLKASMARYPDVRIHLVESLSGYLQEWLEAGRLDLAVLYDPVASPAIRLDPVLVEDLRLVGRSGAFPPQRVELPFGELCNFPLVVPGVSHSLRRLIEGVAAVHGVNLNILAEVDSLTVQKTVVASENVFGIFSLSAIQAELTAGTLQAVCIVEPTLSRSIALASTLSRGGNPACNAIAGLTLEIFRESTASGPGRR
jgi:LysR family nitrogen assimilation transcriptional regulator